MKLDIFIVSFRARMYLARALSALALNTSPGYRLTVYDNTEENYPLTWLWNRMIEGSKREFVALVNPDMIVSDKWDTEALECMESHPDCVSVSPLTNLAEHHEYIEVPAPGADWKSDMDNIRIRAKQAFGTRRYCFTADEKKVVGSCLVIRKRAWEKIGGFNEKIPFAGNDYDFNKRLVGAGYTLGICLNAFGLHYWNSSIKEAKKLKIYDEAGSCPHFAEAPGELK